MNVLTYTRLAKNTLPVTEIIYLLLIFHEVIIRKIVRTFILMYLIIILYNLR